MRAALSDPYDEIRIAEISTAVAQSIDAAAVGMGQWDDVPAALAEAFPGSWGAISSVNQRHDHLNFFASHNLLPQFVNSYVEYFAYVNPWETYWSSVPSGVVNLSEDAAPARQFSHTEFFNDWLRPQNVEAAAGMKLVGPSNDGFRFMLHFPLSATYDAASARVLERVRGNLKRAITVADLQRSTTETDTAAAAIVERGRCAAFIVDGDRVLREANQMAVDLFAKGEAVLARGRRCTLNDRDADARFGRAVDQLARGLPLDGARLTFRNAAGLWQVTLAALPVPWRATSALLRPRQLVLVLVSDLRAEALKQRDHANFAATFGLTQAETRLCARLLEGDSLSEAADMTGITLENARTRLKTIFKKTDTNRQAQLVLLLSRMM